jgi:hypothetical protein
MPSPRRRTAYRAIGAELDRIEVDLLRRLGVVRSLLASPRLLRAPRA